MFTNALYKKHEEQRVNFANPLLSDAACFHPISYSSSGISISSPQVTSSFIL